MKLFRVKTNIAKLSGVHVVCENIGDVYPIIAKSAKDLTLTGDGTDYAKKLNITEITYVDTLLKGNDLVMKMKFPRADHQDHVYVGWIIDPKYLEPI